MRALALLPVLSLIAGCASYSGTGLVPGQATEADVMAVMGQPAMVWHNPDKSSQLAYPRGPAGTQTFMVHLDPDGKLTSIRNVLDSEGFRKILPGMSSDSVLRVLGPPQPAWTAYFAARNELVWEWRYCDDWNALARFDVLMDGTTRLVRTAYSRVEECGPSSHCWCSH